MGCGRRVAAAVILAAFSAPTGCGFAPPQTVPVEGKVVFRGGAPVANANLQFLPDPSSGGTHIANGTTDASGAFKLHTYLNETRSALDGAVPGKYKVEVTGYPGASRIPEKFASPTDTPLRADVPPSGTSALTLELDAGP